MLLMNVNLKFYQINYHDDLTSFRKTFERAVPSNHIRASHPLKSSKGQFSVYSQPYHI